jgi:hypothetical protein
MSVLISHRGHPQRALPVAPFTAAALMGRARTARIFLADPRRG